MNIKSKTLRNWQRVIVIPVLLLGAIFFLLVVVRLITGRSLGLRSFVARNTYLVTNPLRAALDSRSVQSSGQEEFSNIIFLHHSTGNNLIRQGGVREKFQQQGLAFWDHGYNEQGLRNPEGRSTGYSYNIPNDDTNPNGLAAIFHQSPRSLPTNALSGLLQHDVIIFKSCFRPANHIRSDEQLEQYKSRYLEMRTVMDQYPEKIFIVMTIPPLNPSETNSEEAARARVFSEWLVSDEFLSGHPNIFTFDFYSYLAEEDRAVADANMLRTKYRTGDDSHPNQLANETIGPLFVEFISATIQSYKTPR